MVSTSSSGPIFCPAAEVLRVRRLGHAFLAAGHHDLGVAGGDLLRRQRHRPQAGAAELVDAEGRPLHRDAGRHRRLPRRVLPRAGGEDLAQDDLVHLLRLDPGALHRRLDGDVPSVCAGIAAKAPLKLPTGVRAADAMTISVMFRAS
jgi:hypothetical protein